jgi:tRNA threonylcarbamoyl adenosine modification protein YeaZ
MKILALEFSSPQRSVAVIQTPTQPEHSSHSSHPSHRVALAQTPTETGPLAIGEAIETGARSTNALGLVEAALRQAQLDRAQIECLAIGLGPGSYNGIRLSLALAQGWHLAREVKLLGISTAECLAAEAQAAGITGPVHVVIDAQRGEFYLASYDLSAKAYAEIEPLRLASLQDVQVRLQTSGVIVGPEVTKWFPGSRVLFPRASTLGRLAQGRTDFVPGEKLEPIYLRPTQFVKAPPSRIFPS